VIMGLNLAQIIISGLVIILYLVVRSPVRYQSFQAKGLVKSVSVDQDGKEGSDEDGVTPWQCIVHTALDPMVLYYVWYLSFSILGQVYSYDFLPFLLLDLIVKNSTTRDVLNAVIVPRNQIMMGGVIIVFVVQIYSFFLVSK